MSYPYVMPNTRRFLSAARRHRSKVNAIIASREGSQSEALLTRAF
jgi:hypothetical protein